MQNEKDERLSAGHRQKAGPEEWNKNLLDCIKKPKLDILHNPHECYYG